MKLVALVGSVREDSLNMKLVGTMQERYADKFSLDIANIVDLPHFNQDVEEDPPQIVADFKTQVAEADAIIVVTPEFNWSIPGVLKNALDWLSRVNKVMIGKPVLIAGVSPGVLGTIRAQLHLREILQSPGLSARILPPGGNEILINAAADKFNDSGKLVHESTLEFMDSVIDKFMEWVKA